MRRPRALPVLPGLVVAALATVVFTAPAQADQGPGALIAARAAAAAGERAAGSAPRATTTSQPLAGRTIVIDPGHQLGNSHFAKQVRRLVPDGAGGKKACNTTGTATNAGYAEATFAWKVASRIRTALQNLGATVIMSRTANSVDLWGPCVDVRGQLGNKGYHGLAKRASLKLSIHGDGSAARNHGYHVIVKSGSGTMHDRSLTFAKDTRGALGAAGFARSTYIGKGTALSIRGDLATLNWATMPTAMVELGNMRNSADASVMSSSAGQKKYAAALVAGIKGYFGVA